MTAYDITPVVYEAVSSVWGSVGPGPPLTTPVLVGLES